MDSLLTKILRLKFEPVAIFFTQTKPENAFQFPEGKYGCAASMLFACAEKGIVSAYDEKTYGCAGGGVGLCFGNAFEKNNHPTESLLSIGDEGMKKLGQTYFRSLGRGERFYASTEIAKKWKDSMPYTETDKEYVVFKPLSKVNDEEKPDLICIFANPDQLSALVILSGFYRGESVNVTAPYVAACQSILMAYQELEKEKPKAVLGFFDMAQRYLIPKEILSFTVPFNMFREIEQAAPESFLTTEAWKKIEGRQE